VYTLVRHVRLREGLGAEAPAFVLSLVLAEVLYKFHSFTLECLCFLLTWLALSCLFSLVARRFTSEDKAAN
jgi:hypothetical protein